MSTGRNGWVSMQLWLSMQMKYSKSMIKPTWKTAVPHLIHSLLSWLPFPNRQLILSSIYPYGRKWRETKEPLDESEKVCLKLNIQKTKIMASGPITSWQIDRETMETVTDFILGGSQITVDGDCIHEIKRCLLLGRKVMINLDTTLKSWDITLSTKVHLVKAMVFPVVMYGCES